MAQDPTRPLTARYHAHVAAADAAERKANEQRVVTKTRLLQSNPLASKEWIEMECSRDYRFKAHVAAQQFHARQAQMYGIGAILEALSSRG